MSACCQIADDDTLESDPGAFDCGTCEMRHRLQSLDADNAEAWALFVKLNTRFVVDRGLTPMLLERVVASLDDTEASDLVSRLSILHDVFTPPSRPSESHGA